MKPEQTKKLTVKKASLRTLTKETSGAQAAVPTTYMYSCNVC